jgi:hypothetical protein
MKPEPYKLFLYGYQCSNKTCTALLPLELFYMRLDCRGISVHVLANDMVLILEKPQLGHAPDNATSGAVGAKLHMHLKQWEFVADLPIRHCPVITRAPRCRGS